MGFQKEDAIACFLQEQIDNRCAHKRNSVSSCGNGIADIVAESPCLQLVHRSDLRLSRNLYLIMCRPDHICPNKSILSGEALRKLMPLCQTSFSCHICSWSHLRKDISSQSHLMQSSKRHHLIKCAIILNQMLVFKSTSFLPIAWALYLPTESVSRVNPWVEDKEAAEGL